MACVLDHLENHASQSPYAIWFHCHWFVQFLKWMSNFLKMNLLMAFREDDKVLYVSVVDDRGKYCIGWSTQFTYWGINNTGIDRYGCHHFHGLVFITPPCLILFLFSLWYSLRCDVKAPLSMHAAKWTPSCCLQSNMTTFSRKHYSHFVSHFHNNPEHVLHHNLLQHTRMRNLLGGSQEHPVWVSLASI